MNRPQITFDIELKPPRSGKEIAETLEQVATEVSGNYIQRLYLVRNGQRSYELGISTKDTFGDVEIYGNSCVISPKKVYTKVNIHGHNWGDYKEISEAEVEKCIQGVEKVTSELEKRLNR